MTIDCRTFFLHGTDEEVTLHDDEDAFDRLVWYGIFRPFSIV